MVPRRRKSEKGEDGISDPSRKSTITTITTMEERCIPKYYFVNTSRLNPSFSAAAQRQHPGWGSLSRANAACICGTGEERRQTRQGPRTLASIMHTMFTALPEKEEKRSHKVMAWVLLVVMWPEVPVAGKPMAVSGGQNNKTDGLFLSDMPAVSVLM
jgi:hypothetical protein